MDGSLGRKRAVTILLVEDAQELAQIILRIAKRRHFVKLSAGGSMPQTIGALATNQPRNAK